MHLSLSWEGLFGFDRLDDIQAGEERGGQEVHYTLYQSWKVGRDKV